MSRCGMRCGGSRAADAHGVSRRRSGSSLDERRASADSPWRTRPRSWRFAPVRLSCRCSLMDETVACFTRPAAFIHSCERHCCRASCGRSETARSRSIGRRFFEMKSRHGPMATRAPVLRARVDALAATPEPVPRPRLRDRRQHRCDAEPSADRQRHIPGVLRSATDLPAILPEIGRLREMTFRRAGEGTGLARDLDRFDQTYQHLFVWDRSRRRLPAPIASARPTSSADGVERLYTRTLFDYDRRCSQIGPALELGRSFVQPDYQRDFSPLLLCGRASLAWSRRQSISRLFGVVSISDRYNSTSRQLLIKFLQTHASTLTSAGWCARRILPRRRMTRR